MCGAAAPLSIKEMQSEMEPQARAAGCRLPPRDREFLKSLTEKSRRVFKKTNQRAASFRGPFGFERLPINKCVNATVDGGGGTLVQHLAVIIGAK